MKVDIFLKIIILGLCAWRLSSLLARERGPLDILCYIRKYIYRITVYNNIVGKIFMSINNGVACVWCSSVWFGALLSLAVSENIVEWIIYSLAISTIAVLLEVYINGESIN